MSFRKGTTDIGDISDVMEQIGKENEMKEKTSELEGLCKNIIQEEQTLLEKHARARFIEIQKHKEDIHSLFDKGDVWLSSFWMKVLIIFIVGYMGIITLYAALQ